MAKLQNVSATIGNGESRLTITVVADNVIPLLDRLGLHHNSYITNAPKDAGRIGKDIAEKQRDIAEAINVVVAGGDGTAHELIEGIVGLPGNSASSSRVWHLIILPLGTVSPCFSGGMIIAYTTRQMLCTHRWPAQRLTISHLIWRPPYLPTQPLETRCPL